MRADPAPKPYRMVHFSPLRYPGGKGKLAAFVKRLIENNRLSDGHYCEPYAGGAAIALELLFHAYVDQIHINDISPGVYAFWHAVLFQTDRLCRLIQETPVTVETWTRQKAILSDEASADPIELGFAVFFLNRTNRSGILNGGIIGGKDQSGPWKIDARYNSAELIRRIQEIAKFGEQVKLSQDDALDFLAKVRRELPAEKTLVYLDPPYYHKGKELYYDFYQAADHRDVARFVRTKLTKHRWIVSYDNVPEVHALYAGEQLMEYSVGYSARTTRTGAEVMFLSPLLRPPEAVGAMKLIAGGD